MQRFKVALLRVMRFLPDKPYVYIFFWVRTGRFLHLKDMTYFTMKVQWLKLHGHLERFAPFADKYTVREYVERTIGSQYLVPLIGVWDSFDDIPFDELPDRFVLKVSNGCEYNIICKDKSAIDKDTLKTKIQAWQREDYYRLEREAQYKPARPRILCEQYLEDESGGLRDYKFHCSKGKVYYVQIDADRFGDHKEDMRDVRWRKLPCRPSHGLLELGASLPRPKNFDEMLRVVTKLAAPFPYVRVDLYTAQDKIYFGELTFTPGSGTVILAPEEWEVKFGDLIDLDAYAKPIRIKGAGRSV
jgi:hypothetical protein